MLSYIGGKYRQAKWIEEFIPNNLDTYIEVFGGAFWVHLRSSFNAKRVIYNDFNRHMANLFECARNYNKFLSVLQTVEPQDQKLFDEYKKDILSIIENGNKFDLGDMEIGKKYAYLVTQVFSGIMSSNAKMVDLKGKYKSKYLTLQNKLKSPTYQRRFDMITDVFNMSFEEVIPLVDSPTTFFYLDPPYYSTENLYAFHDFGIEQHKELMEIIKNIQGKFILSYYEFDDLVRWFPEDQYVWKRKEYAKASMASKGKGQTKGIEVLVMNFDPDNNIMGDIF